MTYPVVIANESILSSFFEVTYPILEAILSNHEQVDTLATLSDTLLPRLISGRLRLSEAKALTEESCA